MNSDFLSFAACGSNYKIVRESRKWNLYAVTDDCSNELVISSWYPGDILNAATAIQNSNIPYLPPDDDTEDMLPRDEYTPCPSPMAPEPSFVWGIQAELKV